MGQVGKQCHLSMVRLQTKPNSRVQRRLMSCATAPSLCNKMP